MVWFRIVADPGHKQEQRSQFTPFGREAEVVGLTPTKTPNDLNGEFDPGSELTLAECITHASRAEYVAIRI